MLQKKEEIIAFALVAGVLTVVVISAPWIFGLLTNSATFGNRGFIKTVGVGVYSDINCTQALSTLDWGTVEPGSTASISVYIQNEGNTPVTLTLNTTDWTPLEASNHITLSWDYVGQLVNQGDSIKVKFTLLVSDDISEIASFNFVIFVVATG